MLGGQALAELIFGDYNLTGKLTIVKKCKSIGS